MTLACSGAGGMKVALITTIFWSDRSYDPSGVL